MPASMASVSDRNYLPSLEHCLTTGSAPLSWKTVAIALTDSSGESQTSLAVVNFLKDDYVQTLLREPAKVFAPANESTRSDFEARTVPTNVISSHASQWDVAKIKEDAQWLSKNAGINLVAALRLVVIEIQSRSRRQLTDALSSQDAANLREAAGLSNGQAAALFPGIEFGTTVDADEVSADFETTEARQRRLFDTLLTERRYFMMAADYFHSIRLYDQLPFNTTVIVDQLTELYNIQPPSHPKTELGKTLSAYMQYVADSMRRIESGVASVTDEQSLRGDQFEIAWLTTSLVEIVHALSVIFQVVDSMDKDFVLASIVNQWFSMMELYSFFDPIQSIHETIDPLILPLKTLAIAISIAMMSPARSLAYFTEREDETGTQVDDAYDSYLLSSDVLEQVHKCVINAASSSCEVSTPVVLTWAILLHRMNVSYQNRTEKRDNLLQQNARENFETGSAVRPAGRRNSAGSIFSIESSKFDGFLENTTTAKDLQMVEQLASMATSRGRVYAVISQMAFTAGPSLECSLTPVLSSRVRATLLELLKISYPVVGYQSEPVGCLISVLSPGHDYWDLKSSRTVSSKLDVTATIVRDDYAMEVYFQQALDRYPYELVPFTTLCRTLSVANPTEKTDKNSDHPDIILDILRKTSTLTFHLPDHFQEYELVLEDENTNSFCLTQELPLISLSSSWSKRYIEDDAYRIPAGTYGRFVTDTGRIVIMDYPHSSLALLGRRLETNLTKEGYRNELGILQPDMVAESVSLLAVLTANYYSGHASRSQVGSVIAVNDDILHEASIHISGGKDIVTVVCETMDFYMQDESVVDEESAVEVLNACIKFLDSVLPVLPSRVWSYLAKSELLDSEARAGKLTKITGNLDLVMERYDFLTSVMRLFSHVIDSAMVSAVQRRTGTKSDGNLKGGAGMWSGTADKVLERVSYAILQSTVDVFENTATWRFSSDANRFSLLRIVVPILNNVLLYSYGTGNSSESQNLTACLCPAASYVISCFLSPSTGTLRFQPLLTSFIAAITTPESTLYLSQTQTVRAQVRACLQFSTTLLRVASHLGRSSHMIEDYLFKCSTLLARLCAVSGSYSFPALQLLESLVLNASKATSQEPPSLLGYLGPFVSKSFLQLLACLGQPLGLPREAKSTWKFFSSILKSRQQWMSNCLLTGQTPREAMAKDARDAKAKKITTDSVYSAALDKLKNIKTLDIFEALAILDFVAAAQNYWPWTTSTLQKDDAYLDGLRAYVANLQPSHLTVRSDAVRASVEARIAAYAADIFAMQLYHSRHLGNGGALAKELITSVDYFLRDAVEVAGYNRSLQNSFARNFAAQYPGYRLEDFKRTLLQPEELGTRYYYDLERADTMLSFDSGWLGRKGSGFKNEMELANSNLSLVDAQLALFRSWESLLLELSINLPSNETITRQMLQVAQQALDANQMLPGAEVIFSHLLVGRANLALVLIQRLVKNLLPVKDLDQLLGTLVGALNAVDDPFSTESLVYYRTLLKGLFVTLRSYSTLDSRDQSRSLAGSAVPVTQTILNILDHVVARGFRSLSSLIHEQDSAVVPEDLALLTAILQASLSLPGIDQCSSQILNIMASHDAPHAAASLFSWADKLTDHGDPIYGELSILFLLELSSLPFIAEQLACDGVLSSLLSTNLARFMLKTSLTPLSDSPYVQRCYAIWVKGFLPLMVNMLTALGATIAPEITYVLNRFPHLLKSSVERFEAPGASRTESSSSQYVTLIAVSEIHTLALLVRVLATLRANNSRDIPTVPWDAAGLLENVEFWLSSNRLLSERLLPLGERQLEWRSTKTGTSDREGSHNLLESMALLQFESVRDILSDGLDQ